LKPAHGEATLNLLKLVASPLSLEIRTAIHEAGKSRTPVRRDGLQFKRNGHTSVVDLEVVPIEGRTPSNADFLVLFPNLRTVAPATRPARAASGSKTKAGLQELEQLKRELASTQDRVRGLMEDQEASAEELRAANEEILSSNEELQSTNEELETAKEELQSSNEELTTLNEELQNRNAELGQSASDLTALLNGIEIPVIILGKDLLIRRFTPAAEKLLNLIPSDLGRPIGQIRPNLDLPDLDRLVANVVGSFRPVQVETRDVHGRWYLLRARPYKSRDQVDGVLLAVIDIHDQKNFSSAIVETVTESLLVLDSSYHVLMANTAFYTMFHVTKEETEGRLLFDLGSRQWDIPELRRRLQQAIPSDQATIDFEVEHDFPSIGRRTMTITARRLDQTAEPGILLVIQDITLARRATQKLEAEAAALIRLGKATSNLWHMRTLSEGLDEMLAASIALMGADMGNIQLLDTDRQVLRLSAHRGLTQDFLEHFREVSADDPSACGRSLRLGTGVVIEDIETDPLYEPLRPLARSTGYRAVHTTPLVARDGAVVGMISTHFRTPHRPDEQDVRRLELYARVATDFIERQKIDDEMTSLSDRLLTADENLRKELSRELHDDVGQRLAVNTMRMVEIETQIPGDPAAAAAQLKECRAEVVNVAKQVQEFARGLHPVALLELGLEVAVRGECERYARAGLPVSFSVTDLPASIPDSIGLCMYRVTQEALANAGKHSESNRADVRIRATLGALELVIEDFGRGFLPEGRKTGLGLFSMEERVRLCGGTFSLNTREGQGTRIEVRIPLTEK
jgi:PAS domain S-box-containing protein